MKLELYYPIKPIVITQHFGEVANLQYYISHGINIIGHNGIDYIAKRGQEVRASHDGTCYPEVDSSQGHGVVLITDKEFDYQNTTCFFKTIYWHLIDNIPVKNGQKVKAGEVIGYANSTGLSSGDHLHFGLKPVTRNESPDDWINLESNNGYFGAIDPEPYFNKKYASDIGIIKIDHFTVNLERGMSGEEVKKLQQFLAGYGYLSQSEVIGIYGPRTQNAIFKFQLDFVVPLTWLERYVYQGRYWGQKSRTVANNLFT